MVSQSDIIGRNAYSRTVSILEMVHIQLFFLVVLVLNRVYFFLFDERDSHAMSLVLR